MRILLALLLATTALLGGCVVAPYDGGYYGGYYGPSYDRGHGRQGHHGRHGHHGYDD